MRKVIQISDSSVEDVLPCIYCYTCISRIYLAQSMTCAVNPETAFERELAIRPAAPPKRVVVVGGGPAGMESARRLAARGHDVTLIERSNRLGGALQFAAIVYEPNERLLTWLTRQIEASSVELRLDTEATVELLRGSLREVVAPSLAQLSSDLVGPCSRRALPPVRNG